MGSVPPVEEHDILVLGAGLSGINTAHVLRDRMPHRQITILEKRDQIGGTWNFFKYPGFRTDSYLNAFGLGWYPWTKPYKMASGPEILEYLKEAVDKDGLEPLIRFKHKITGLEFKTEEQKWTLYVDADGKPKTMRANFVVGCMGYYADNKALEADIPGLDRFDGRVVHSQWWPEDLDYKNKRMVLIGSGATAITVIPELVKDAAHVVQLQRSPSYVLSRSTQPIHDWWLHLLLPFTWACLVSRWVESVVELLSTEFLLMCPGIGRKVLMDDMKKQLPADVDPHVHFNPSYGPFQQRLGLCPQGDYFKALHKENCEIVTDHIDTVMEDGILLKSGRNLEADIIVQATGLYFQLFDGIKPRVDGVEIDPGQHYSWRGMALDCMPNAAFIFGYVTSSWTPGANAMAHMVVRLLQTMEKKGAATVVPFIKRTKEVEAQTQLAVSANPGYILKAADRMPKTTGHGPWYGRKNLFVDTMALWFGSMEDGLVYGGFKDKSV
ncbi:FAD-containing monooxygenase-like protein [Emericellopsis cladophorae]|uniref:FAD-containing monooxygenase-like protein n=1 Tax=Emericellopsis cladophorae TaxID=2686198 RepID=A0A9P9XY78_9HYPO|nr:FAD-containing monooxygenase-like protein [Emericellopsis cladophorae]KAI6779783.1 FAD-containing monooxygenase-like protein [Emericellopsis cladophorae]